MASDKFNERLRALRESRNRTQLEVAEAIGLTRAAYSLYETGKRDPSIDTIIALLEYFGVGAEVLFPVEHEAGKGQPPMTIKMVGEREPTPEERAAIEAFIRFTLRK